MFYYNAYLLSQDDSIYEKITQVIDNAKCQYRRSDALLYLYFKGVDGSYAVDIGSNGRKCDVLLETIRKYQGDEIELLVKGRWIYQIEAHEVVLIGLSEVAGSIQKESLQRGNFLFVVGTLVLMLQLFKRIINKKNRGQIEPPPV